MAAGTDRNRKSLSMFGSDLRNHKEAIDAFGQAVGLLGKVDPTGMAGLAAQAAVLGVAVAPAVGTLAVLPGVLLAGAAAMAVVKIGTAGMGDAFKAVAEGDAKKLDEAMKKLSPSAQEVVRQYAAMKPAMDGVKMNVQEALFRGMGTTVQQLGATYLPVMNQGLTAIATQMGSMAQQSAKALMAPETVSALNQVLTSTESLFRELGAAPGDFLAGIINMAGVGSQYLGAMGESVAGLAMRFRQWTASAEGQAQINSWIERGIAVLQQLWAILGNIASIALSIFRPLNTDAQGFLATLVQLTAKMAAWAASAEGQRTIANIWNLLATVGGNLLTIIAILAPIIASIANAFAMLPAPVQQVIGFMATWSTILGVVFAKLTPLIGLLIQLGPVIMKIGPALTMLMNGFMAVMRVFRALSLLMMTNPWVLLIVAVVALAMAIYQNWDAIWAFLQAVWAKITAAWQVVVSFFSSTGASVWETIKSAWTTAINAIVSFFSAVWSGLTAYWSNLINTILAIGRAVWDIIKTVWQAAILTIWALLTGRFDLLGQIWSTLINKIKAIGSNLWNEIKGIWGGAISAIVSTITGFVSTVSGAISGFVSRAISFFVNMGSSIVSAVTSFVSRVISFFSNLASQGPAKIQQMGSQMVSSIGSAISSFVSRVASGVGQVIGQFTSLVGRVVSTLASLPGRMVALGGQIISGIISGITGAAGRLFSYLGGLAARALASAKAAFGIGSPSKKFRDLIGKELPEGIAVGVIASAKVANQAAKDMAIGVTASAIDGLSDVQVQRVGALIGANTAATSGAITGASVAASAGVGSTSSRTLSIGELKLDVKGIIDPTDPVSWRRFGEEVRELLVDVEASYK